MTHVNDLANGNDLGIGPKQFDRVEKSWRAFWRLFFRLKVKILSSELVVRSSFYLLAVFSAARYSMFIKPFYRLFNEQFYYSFLSPFSQPVSNFTTSSLCSCCSVSTHRNINGLLPPIDGLSSHGTAHQFQQQHT